MKYFLQYGLQRSGTNYTGALLKSNFKDVEICNELLTKSLPTHKHFRLYDEKWFIHDTSYRNNFNYPNFLAFKEHVVSCVSNITDDVRFIITIKDPIAWYLSYNKKKNEKKNYIQRLLSRKKVLPEYMIEYNLFYKKWFQFAKENKDILIVKYEDLLLEKKSTLLNIQSFFQLIKKDDILDVKKVYNSDDFNRERYLYYKDRSYLHNVSDTFKRELLEHVDPEIRHLYKYE